MSEVGLCQPDVARFQAILAAILTLNDHGYHVYLAALESDQRAVLTDPSGTAMTTITCGAGEFVKNLITAVRDLGDEAVAQRLEAEV